MEYFVERAPNYLEAQHKVIQKYGNRAKILSQRTVPTGGFAGLFRREAVEVTGYLSRDPRDLKTQSRGFDFEEEKRKFLGNMRPAENTTDNAQDINIVLTEIQKLSERLNDMSDGQSVENEHPKLRELRQLLVRNDFNSDYINTIMHRTRDSLSLTELDDRQTLEQKIVTWIGEEIATVSITPKRKPEIITLIGPTGVGKTTTIAKMSKRFGINERGKKVSDIRIITIDNYRIGAREQIETYGRIMDIPVCYVESAVELRRQMMLCAQADYVLVDTIGKSPRNSKSLGEMNEMLSVLGADAHTSLVVSASTKTVDLLNIMQQYEPFGYQSVVVTKLDETYVVGNVLSALKVRPKPLLFYSTGQGVPHDIEEATVERMLIRLDGFQIDRQTI